MKKRGNIKGPFGKWYINRHIVSKLVAGSRAEIFPPWRVVCVVNS
jgi:hypothetical protein